MNFENGISATIDWYLSNNEWIEKVNEARNFFKHADRDLRAGIESFEFETRMTEFYIFEAIRCLKIVEGTKFDFSLELRVFSVGMESFVKNSP